MKKLGNILCYAFILLLILLDLFILAYFFNLSDAPVYYYICLICIFVSVLILLILQIKLKNNKTRTLIRLIPAVSVLLALLFSSVFLYTGIRDGMAMKKPLQATITKTKFLRIPHSIGSFSLKDTYRMEGIDLFDQTLSLAIDKNDYQHYSYIMEQEYMEYDSKTEHIVYSYKYSEDSKLVADYLPISKKVINLVEITPSSHTYTQKDDLNSIEAKITSVLDDRTMEAVVTSTGEYKGSHVKEGDTITIEGTMTILYPYNVQGFYEIKEGDVVEFSVDHLTTGDSIVVTTSVLNLAEEQTEGEKVE